MEDLEGTLDQGLNESSLDPQSAADMRTAGGWAIFFAVFSGIVALIYVILLIGSLSGGSNDPFAQAMPSGMKTIQILSRVLTIGYLAVMIVFYFKFYASASKIKQGGSSRNIEDAFLQLKNIFMTIGLSTFIILAFSLVSTLILMTTMAAAFGGGF